ncbi:guanylate cyclase soluble subunit beta-2-like isoform X2 [Denticeps clupeoides]|uniref:guanylate cyclase soluble subunit beta-2-like isoform X2 n=1 Tax=Denticeps clupeoides TaxID=299321 RepID=UPI0010A557BE|nr:guanylate cyclase soluble subunit beta-2-like isoform X2 [Denticeps clupeoides]
MGGDGSMLLHYYSERRGLGHIVPGIMGAVARDFFNSTVRMEVVSQAQEEQRTGKKEHVVFRVDQTFNPADRSQEKGGSSRRNQWDAVRRLVHLGKGKLLRGFEPVYPDQLCIDLKTFCNTFPFHLVFDEELKVRQAGVNIQRIVPGLQVVGIQLDHYFTILHPEVTFTIGSIRTFINSHFVLQTRRDVMPAFWRDKPMLQLRGQMLWMESLQCMFYQASPLLRSLLELEERSMHLSDIAPHDATRDLILLNQQRLAEMELSSQLERKKEELRLLSQHLEEEKQKTETLLYTMLPKHVANQLKEGKKVEAGEFKESTILFSDVVTFTNICSACEPIQIVFMLNSMYLKFDRLTTVHSIYKVETIGDAYMVVGGVPVPVSSHAERVANFALGMIIAAKEVTNPVTGGPIQIRVGMHSGPVLAGVVGEKMPRYCLFGDTVNTASRMESHGRPDKIHLSPTARRALEGKGFVVKERGELEVKGKGRMFTYFLEGNLASTEDQIMGRPARDARSPQKLQDEDGDAVVPMHYEESLASLLGQPRDSESYGSLHTGSPSEEKPAAWRPHVPRRPRRIRTAFCLLF